MSPMHRLRAVHAALGLVVIAAYVSGEWGDVHSWIGYGVVLIIGARLALMFTGLPQLGLIRFYPQFAGLKLDNALTHPAISRSLLVAIAFCLLGTVLTGVALDRGEALGMGEKTSLGQSATESEPAEDEAADGDGPGEAFEEIHETLANMLMLLIGVHVAYLLAFKRPLAKFMLFFGEGARRSG